MNKIFYFDTLTHIMDWTNFLFLLLGKLLKIHNEIEFSFQIEFMFGLKKTGHHGLK